MKVKNKTIVITGAGNGIGRQLVLQLLEKGLTVLALDISEEGLEETKKLANNELLSIYKVDMSKEEDLNNFKKQIDSENIEVDALINNAGIIQPFININELDISVLYNIMNINFFGAVKLTKLFLPDLLKRSDAHIVNVSSMGGFFPFPGQTAYASSKAALKLFTEGLYSELLNTNVRVTIVFPGAIATDIAKNSHVDLKINAEESSYKMMSAEDAAREIIEGMENDVFQLYVGSDSKFMNFLYKFNPKSAIKYINKKMNLK